MTKLVFKVVAMAILMTPFSAMAFNIRGRVISALSRKGIPYASVVIEGNKTKGAATDSLGYFTIEGMQGGVARFEASCIGYTSVITPEYLISAFTPLIEIELTESLSSIEAVSVAPSPYARDVESPVSLRAIGIGDLERSAGANRDVARIVRTLPGVAFSPIGYRNDLIVRGGGPSENTFYIDGIEIPNINHFATQGASGGPVSILNADLIRQVKFYTGAFPVDKGNALSSVMDITLRDGNPDKQRFKATLGASEVAFSGSGHFNSKATYLFSVRQSYLQLLFKLLGLPFLPNYIDAQAKVRIRPSSEYEITVLGVMGVDNMRLNLDEKGEENEYILSYIPKIEQETFTLGATLKHFGGKHIQTFSVGYSFFTNRNKKYIDNDESSENNLRLRLRSREGKATARFENRTLLGKWRLREGAELSVRHFFTSSKQLLPSEERSYFDYNTRLAFVGYALFFSADYRSLNERLTASMGVRVDGASYSSTMAQPWRQLSPRASLSYSLGKGFYVSGSTGLYYELPPLTALGFREDDRLANKSLEYMRVFSSAVGAEYRLCDRLAVSLEGFYKLYSQVPLSVADGVPLTCKGNDYGVTGNEELVSTAQGRAYGAELSARWQIPNKVNIVGAFTLYWSEYRSNRYAPYIPSAWDNRWIVNISGTYDLPHRWSIGAKLSAIGGAPYTPYDEEQTSLKTYWDATGRAALDYSRYNEGRLKPFVQLDVRVDKVWEFRKWSLGVYIDLENVTFSEITLPDALLSTGVIKNPSAPLAEQRYELKKISQRNGTLIPTIGITAEF
ncbi:MAG: TonB-dependent receptor [Alistipes sp.]|nr:TonB-dependent receptor [Alistipes sp.]